MTRESVLLVDAELEFVEGLAERLRGRGFEVETVHDGATAVERVTTRPYDAVVLDFALPDIKGIETLQALFAANAGLQVMMLSGQVSIKNAMEATRLGAMDVLEKPTDIETMVEKIHEARARRAAATETSSKIETDESRRA